MGQSGGMKRERRHKCAGCKSLYPPDPRAKYHQRYCSSPACRKASKAASQRKWRRKPENRNYFRGPDQVDRVQRYWRTHPRPARKKRSHPSALQERIIAQPVGGQGDEFCLIPSALQDDFLLQPAVLVGVISSLTGSALQEEIVRNVRQFHTRGQMILDRVSRTSGGERHDREASVGAGTIAQGP
jgi:hypothetical protein